MSPNPPEFELICYLRWFYLLALLEREGLQEAFYFDSDVLLYGDCAAQRDRIRQTGSECGLSVPAQPFESYIWTGCGHASYWQIDILREFCSFCIKSYTDPFYGDLYDRKMQWQLSQGVRGGICDMTTLYLFWREHPDRIFNLAEENSGSVVDHNVVGSGNYQDDEYVMAEGIKQIRMIEGLPYFSKAADQRSVQAHSIHFQGARKKLIPRFYTGDTFPGKLFNELKMAIRSAPKRLSTWVRQK